MAKKKSKFLSGKRIDPTPIDKDTTLADLVDESFMAYNAARIREACRLFTNKMLADDVTVGVTLTGALTPAGLGISAIIPLIKAGFIDWIISTGANLYHDTHFGIGLSLHQGDAKMDDRILREEEVVRIYDIFFDYSVLLDTDEFFRRVIEGEEFQRTMSSAEFHFLCGKYVREREIKLGIVDKSLLAVAYEYGVPIYTSSPGDSSIGMNIAAKELQGSKLILNPNLDVNETASIVLAAKRGLIHTGVKSKKPGKSAIFILGGGSPKNFALQTEPQIQEVLGIDEKGHDYFLQITDARSDTGGLCVAEGTLIDTPRDLSVYPKGVPIENLVGKSGFYVYSFDHEEKKITLSEVEKVWKTGEKEVYRLRYGWWSGQRKDKWLEDEILATPEHLIMLTNGSYKPLKILKKGESLKAFNTSYSTDGYRQIGLGIGKTISEHRYLLEFALGRKLEKTEVAHHLDHNHLNNSFDNLAAENYRVHASNHRKIEWQRKSEVEKEMFREINRQRMTSEKAQKLSRRFWDNLSAEEFEIYKEKKRLEFQNLDSETQEYRRKRAREWFSELPKEEQERRREYFRQQSIERFQNLSEQERKEWNAKVRLENNGRFKSEIDEETVRKALTEAGGKVGKTCEILGADWRTFDRRLKMYGITRAEIRERYVDNHKVISVEPTGITIPVYDMKVKKTHNFVANGIVVHNSGATPGEAVSWGKIDPDQLPDAVVAYVDSTVALPIITAYALARHEPREPKRLFERRGEFMDLLKKEYEKSTRR
ncbi:MAG: deoxyhypusine synthase [Pyrinomonadaceae bacterium]|nr:deoxyhypusine synthase [Pyrinomonadaceae bacterium]